MKHRNSKRRLTLIGSSLFIFLLSFSKTHAQGWPADYGGVMLQGFYWDSYADTNWQNLESQADELSKYFDLIWVPNSAYANAMTMNMGYHPVYWFDHKSAFGTEAQLRSMIKAFKDRGTGLIEDVVINHRASVDGDWLHFPAETYKGVTYQLTATDICQDDESKDSGYKPTGAKDTGEGWGGARDLDHSGTNVQKNVMAYEDFLLNDLGYVGFRYDFVKGFAAKYVGKYNKAANVTYSVGECWDGNKSVVTNWINGTKVDGVIQSAAFDFPMKYYINSAFSNNGSNWADLNKAALSTDPAYARYAVTFVDNHDTGRSTSEGGAPLYANVEAANAFILTLPGTPCIFLKHWQQNKQAIKKLIAVRKAAGITNESKILSILAEQTGCTVIVQGSKGNVVLLLGQVNTGGNNSSDNYKMAVKGTNYMLFVSGNVDLSAVEAIDSEVSTFTAPDFCTITDGEVCAFFEAPKSWTSVKCWAWDSAGNYTGGTWPGASCTRVGTTADGLSVWKWTWNNAYTGAHATMPANIIFNNNNNGQQTADLDFVNTGYYSQSGSLLGAVNGSSGIDDLRFSDARDNGGSRHVYDLSGRRADASTHGLLIVGGKKVVRTVNTQRMAQGD